MKKDLLSVNDFTAREIEDLFILTDKLKKNKGAFINALKTKVLALIFQKPSNRTRVSFEVGMYQLGGHCLYLSSQEISLGVRESIEDVAKTLSRYVDGIVLRTFEHRNAVELAKYASVPIINGLSDFEHPCQALADIYTVREKIKDLKKATLAYVGDGNNVCHSLIYACAKYGLNINISTPKGFEPDKKVFSEARIIAQEGHAAVKLFVRPTDAVRRADVVYTDVWASMGQEKEAEARKKIFKDFQVNARLLSLAKKNALLMHCLPAHRGQEITDQVINSRNSVVFDQAENRMHVQKAILIKLLR